MFYIKYIAGIYDSFLFRKWLSYMYNDYHIVFSVSMLIKHWYRIQCFPFHWTTNVIVSHIILHLDKLSNACSLNDNTGHDNLILILLQYQLFPLYQSFSFSKCSRTHTHVHIYIYIYNVVSHFHTVFNDWQKSSKCIVLCQNHIFLLFFWY